LIAKGLGYDECARVRKFPLFSLGSIQGGLVVEGRTSREYPLGDIAHRIVGYERTDGQGNVFKVGLEGAFSKYLSGVEGRHLKQKIAQGQWKPIEDSNEIDPKDGDDVVSSININIQDIAHHALLKQLETYQADHGCAVVMEVATGEIKAITNLGRNKDGSYAERLNYAIGETYEPGSVFKTVSLVVALEEAKIDTTYMVDTKKGMISFYGRQVWDSNHKGYGKINLSKAMQVSSNTAIVQAIHDLFGKNPKKFVDKINKMHLNRKLGMAIQGEKDPFVPQPGQRGWSGIALEWMAFGYGLEMTPLQVLTFYNAIANNGKLMRPRFVKKVSKGGLTIMEFPPEPMKGYEQICKPRTVKLMQEVLRKVVSQGLAKKAGSELFQVAGKTGTAQMSKGAAGYKSGSVDYLLSFAGYFPADAPRYSCIVCIQKTGIPASGGQMCGPVFKNIAEGIMAKDIKLDARDARDTASILCPEVKSGNVLAADYVLSHLGVKTFADWTANSLKGKAVWGHATIHGGKAVSLKRVKQYGRSQMPDVHGMGARDAVYLVESRGIKVRLVGRGRVVKQSIEPGTPLKIGMRCELVLEG